MSISQARWPVHSGVIRPRWWVLELNQSATAGLCKRSDHLNISVNISWSFNTLVRIHRPAVEQSEEKKYTYFTRTVWLVVRFPIKRISAVINSYSGQTSTANPSAREARDWWDGEWLIPSLTGGQHGALRAPLDSVHRLLHCRYISSGANRLIGCGLSIWSYTVHF